MSYLASLFKQWSRRESNVKGVGKRKDEKDQEVALVTARKKKRQSSEDDDYYEVVIS